MTDRLRELLEEMTRDITQIKTLPVSLETISRIAPHSIRVLPAPFDEPLGEFNCVMYALGLTARITTPCRPLGHFYADTTFLRRLIDLSILQPCIEGEGALVVWSSDATIKHIGVVAGPCRATSKWGIGYVYEHALLEVPKSYGDTLTFYGSIAPDAALNHLSQYWSRGGRV